VSSCEAKGIENSSLVSVFDDRDAETDRPVLSVFIRTCFTFRLLPVCHADADVRRGPVKLINQVTGHLKLL
jgi:hypothetical protein